MKHVSSCLFILAVTLMSLCGCRKESSRREPSLNEHEIYFGNRLSSISPDGDSACFIGDETGNIYIYDKRSGKTGDTLRTGTDRIYKVMARRTADGIRYLVGIRNSGLAIYRRSRGALIQEDRLIIPQLRDRYSPYDFTVYGNMIYVATSSGLFQKRLDVKGHSTMERIYPEPRGGRIFPMRVLSLVTHGRHIYAASDSGLIVYDAVSNRLSGIMHRGEKITGAALVGRHIHALADRRLYIDSLYGGKSSAHYDTGISAKVYYFAGNTHYFICNDEIVAVHAKDIGNRDKYRHIALRRTARTDCHNIITANGITQHSLLVTENALFCIPFHLDVFNTDGTTTAACAGDNGTYFVTNNCLFVKKDGSGEAVRIADLPEDDIITDIMVKDGVLYYISGGKELKRKKIGGTFFLNSLSGKPDVVLSSPRGITAAGMDVNGRIYIGVRDGLLTYMNGVIRHPHFVRDPYVNRFAANGEYMYGALLNGGILRIKGDDINITEHSDRYHFIKDLAFAEFSDSPCILTNHLLLSPDGRHSVEAEGSGRLLTADGKTFYVIMEQGVRKYVIDKDSIRMDGDTLRDIRFSPAISLAHNNRVYLGAPSLGIMEIGPGGKSQWIKFNHSVYSPDYKTLIFIFLILCLSAGFFLWHRNRKRRDFGLYSEWEKIRKETGRINPKQAQAMAVTSARDTEAVERAVREGRCWLERYRLLVGGMAPYKELSGLRYVVSMDGVSAVCDSINRLASSLSGNDFDLNGCEKDYEEIKNALHCLDTDKLKKDIESLYEEGRSLTERINSGFGDRLRERMEYVRHGFFDDIGGALEVLRDLNKKMIFMSAARDMQAISSLLENIRQKRKTFNNVDISGIIAQVDCRLINMYMALAADSGVAGLTGFKPEAHKGEGKVLTKREKALLLTLVSPEVDWDITRALYEINDRSNSNNIKIVNNLRATYSKVKKEIVTKKGMLEQLMSGNTDSTALFFKDMLDSCGK